MADAKAKYLAPKNETERKLVQIWGELLNVGNVGVNDNFFELGGHSLLGIKLLTLIAVSKPDCDALATVFQLEPDCASTRQLFH